MLSLYQHPFVLRVFPAPGSLLNLLSSFLIHQDVNRDLSVCT